MIRICKIDFHNYRQYRDFSISFESKYSNLYVIKAKNGTGKTTFLNSILWCLYGTEYYITDSSKALPLLNDGVSNDTINNSEDVSVSITIEDGDSFLVFKRVQHFVIKTDPRTNTRNASISGKSELEVSVTKKEGKENTKTFINDEAGLLVKQYFDEAIYSYFFFDGENLKNFFSTTNSSQIKKSIHNISQVNLLSDAIDHTLGMGNELSREANKNSGDIDALYKQEDDLQNNILAAQSENASIDKKRPEYQQLVADCEEKLRGYEPVKQLQLKRDKLNNDLSSNKKMLVEVYENRNKLIRDFTVLLNFYPYVKHALDLIELKEKQGSLPPSVDKKQVIQILNEHILNCPLCDGKIDDRAKNHLQDLLSRLELPYGAAIDLKEIKGSLESMAEQAADYKIKRDRVLENEKYYLGLIDGIERELKEIKQKLSNFDSEDDSINVAQIEKDKSYYDSKIMSDQRKYGENLQSIKDDTERLKEVRNQIKKLEDEKSTKDILTQKARVFKKVSSSLEQIKNSIMKVVKEDIETDTWRIFDNMIWKKNTFKKVVINDNYELSVINMSGKEMLGGLGATEYMALAYSFTLAIHKAAGKNCPLVVDSPLGRTSDDNREKMAAELLKVSKEKQIIMLFTPDEYSQQVREIYDGNVVIKDISLTDDEKEIAKDGE